ncbi:D-beta-hydroxybutyrate dehydrogenase, mitochondrial-like [Saccoglossus kowalevskii]
MRFLVITLALVVALLAVLLQTSCSIGLKSIAFVVVAITYYIVREVLAKRTIEVSGKAVFITGCDSGFGHHLAQRLNSAGVIVFAGCLFEDGEGAATLKSTCSKTLNVVPLDVTSDESVTKARHFVEDNLPNHCEGLWSVVNNAGIWKWGEIEWIKVDILKQLMDVNVFGMMRVTKEFQPLVRKAKGRIVNVGSMSGMWTCPAGAMYCMSKHAVESFT